MVTALLDRVPAERISERAHAARPGRVLLVILLGVPFAAGWLACKLLALLWLALAWAVAAAVEGWLAAWDGTEMAERWAAARADAQARQVRRGAARAG